jgi:hypothetical protein
LQATILNYCPKSGVHYSLSTISINPALLDSLSPTALSRLKKIIADNTQNTPNSSSISCPANLFDNILNKNKPFLITLEAETVGFLNKHSYLPISPNIAQASDTIWNQYIKILLQKAETSSFDTANNFSRQFPNIDAAVSNIAIEIDLLKLVIGVIKAAEWGAWHPNTVVTSKFETFVKTKEKVVHFCNSNKTEVETILNDKFGGKFTADSFAKEYLQPNAV